MHNIYTLQNDEQLRDEASMWIAKLDRELNEVELLALQQWMAADTRNKPMLLKMAEIWDRSYALSRLAVVFPHTHVHKTQSAIPRFALAASILLVGMAGLWIAVSGGSSTALIVDVDRSTSDQGVYETAIGDHATVQLSDGSELAMNTNSKVQVVFNKAQRLIFLERGEISIDVSPDVHRPLSVIAGNRIFRAVGTAFSIRLDSSQEIELVVSHGRVLVGIRPEMNNDSHGQQVLLAEAEDSFFVEKGGRVLLGSASPEIVTLDAKEIEVRLSWADGNLIFRGEPLGEIVAEISRYTTIEFVFLDEDIKTVRVGGLFKTGDVSGFLSTLQANFNVVYEHIDDGHVLLKSSATAAKD